jgi:hypothetical protein
MRRPGQAVLFLLALVAAGFVGAFLSGHLTKGPTSPPLTTSSTAATTATTTTTTIPHASVKVLVANGTQQNGAAAHFTQVLQAQGWSMGTPTNTTAAATSTTVYYAPTEQPQGVEIASELGLKSTVVQPLTITAPVTGTAGIEVIVVIGPDLASQAATVTSTT